MTVKRSFKEMVSILEEGHSRLLMDRARTANRIAKQSAGRNRRRAYAVKHAALTTLVEKLPSRALISKDARLSEFVVVSLASDLSGLHMPADFVRNH